MSFRFRRLGMPGVILVEPQVHEDRRGSFVEVYKRSEFEAAGIPVSFVQDNYSHSVRGVLRGLHYQKPPRAQGKLVMVLRGQIFDAAVDLRRDSPTYGRWIGVTLSAAERRMLYVPEGFAHGFCVVSDVADLIYKVTAEHAAELEDGIRWNDPHVGIRWPVPDPSLSERDAALPLFQDRQFNFAYEGPR